MSRVTIRVRVWKTATIADDTVGAAEDAIEDLADELDTDCTVSYQGTTDANTPYDTYEEYIEAFEEADSTLPSYHNLLIYNRRFESDEDQGPGLQKWPNLGASRGMYRYGQECYSIANGNLYEAASIDLPGFGDVSATSTIFKNIVKHELLHSMLDDSNSPSANTDPDDHSFGSVTSSFWQLDDYASPMVTGYSEPIYGNDPPEDTCSGDPEATGWTSSISDCTKDEGARWLEDEFYVP